MHYDRKVLKTLKQHQTIRSGCNRIQRPAVSSESTTALHRLHARQHYRVGSPCIDFFSFSNPICQTTQALRLKQFGAAGSKREGKRSLALKEVAFALLVSGRREMKINLRYEPESIISLLWLWSPCSQPVINRTENLWF